MEIYALDNNFVPIHVIEDHSSMVWAERFNELGDFHLTIPYHNPSTANLSVGTWLGLDVSDRIMRVDTLETIFDEDGTLLLDVKGESIEAILKHRIYWRSSAGSTINTPYRRTGSVVNLLRNTLILVGFTPSSGSWESMHPQSFVPESVATNLYPPDNITDVGSMVSVADKPTDAWSFMSDIMKSYNLGLRFYRNRETKDGLLYCNVYLGSNRVLNQTARDPVVFSPSLDNIQNQSVTESIREEVIGVWVWDTSGARTSIYYPDYGNAPPFSGLNLRINTIVTEPPEDADAADRLAHRMSLGIEHLNTHSHKILIDGETTRNSAYTYGEDYFLGDRVEMLTDYGYSDHMRVTEQIFVSDAEGTRSYPTLSTERIVNQDSWMGQPTSLHWAQAQGSWSEQ